MMGQRIDNITKAFANPRIRGIFITIFVLMIIAVSMGYFRLKTVRTPDAGGEARVANTPSIGSIPGTGTASREYVKLQEQQNALLSEEALQQRKASIPTLTRATYLETGMSSNAANEEGGSCSVEELKSAREVGVAVEELRCRGCSLAALKGAGFSAGELREAGFSAKDLKDAEFSADDLKAAGFNAKELAQAGFAARELSPAGYSVVELKDAGFTPQALKDAGFTADELKISELVDIGKNCNLANLKGLRAKSIKPEDLRSLGCSISSLKAAGFAAAELKAAGFGADALKNAGFTAAELKTAGFSAEELKKAGFSAEALKNAGFTAAQLKVAGFSAGELKRIGFSAEALKEAGSSVDELKKAGFAPKILKQAGFSAAQLKGAGFTDGDLTRAGFTGGNAGSVTQEVKESGGECSVSKLRQARMQGVNLLNLKSKGCGIKALQGAGFSEGDLFQAGFSHDEIAAAARQPSGANLISSIGGSSGMGGGSLSGSDDAANSVQGDLQLQLETVRAQQAQQVSAQEYQDKMKQVQQAMNTQAGDLFAAWMPLPSQQFVQGAENKADATGGKSAASADKNGAGGNQQAVNPNVDIIKAGTILFAVLDTGVNSDEKSPIMATIVDGDLKGAKILGDFRRVEKKVVLQFSLLSVQRLPSSIAINAVAIDPNTARTALVSHVDSHYMLRFGTAFAASFASGVGQAMQNSANSVTINTSTGQSINLNGSMSAGKAAVVGLGEVGNKFSTLLAPLASTPPTVEVNAGSGLGILLMADLSVPKKTS